MGNPESDRTTAVDMFNKGARCILWNLQAEMIITETNAKRVPPPNSGKHHKQVTLTTTRASIPAAAIDDSNSIRPRAQLDLECRRATCRAPRHSKGRHSTKQARCPFKVINKCTSAGFAPIMRSNTHTARTCLMPCISLSKNAIPLCMRLLSCLKSLDQKP